LDRKGYKILAFLTYLELNLIKNLPGQLFLASSESKFGPENIEKYNLIPFVLSGIKFDQKRGKNLPEKLFFGVTGIKI
jgi:hypothetical protein